jgi:sugar O-acyltransferase (sialic acid O-acetyltransferase NeuD family)
MELALIGAGGFADEVRAQLGEKIKCFVDEEYFVENNNNVFPISVFDPTKYKVLVAIGDSKLRKLMVERLPNETQFFSFIHPSAQILSQDFVLGEGSIVCAGCIITTNCKIGKHAHLNLLSTVGHNCTIGDFFTTAPGTKISGDCKIGDSCYFGTNSVVIQKKNITKNVIVGAGAVVVKDINEEGTYVGAPAKKIK